MTTDEARPILERLVRHWHNSDLSRAALEGYAYDLRDLQHEQVRLAVESFIREGRPFVPLAGEIRRRVLELQLDVPTWSQAIRALMRAQRSIEAFRFPEKCMDGNKECDGTGMIALEETYETVRRKKCSCVKSRAQAKRMMALFQRGEAEPCAKGRCNGSGLVEFPVEIAHVVARPCSCQPKLSAMRMPGLNEVLREFVALVGWSMIKAMLTEGDTTLEAQLRNKYTEHVTAMTHERSLVGLPSAGLPAIERANEPVPVLAGFEMPKLKELPA